MSSTSKHRAVTREKREKRLQIVKKIGFTKINKALILIKLNRSICFNMLSIRDLLLVENVVCSEGKQHNPDLVAPSGRGLPRWFKF